MMKRTLFTVAAISLLSTALVVAKPSFQDGLDTRVAELENQRIATIKESSRAAISIFGPGGNGGGSGVVISADGIALTNYHVIKSCGSFMKCSMPDGVLYDAVIVGIDPTGDVAVVKLLGRDDFPTAVLGDSDHVEMGDWCFAVGNPFLLATDFQPTVSWGIVSGTHRYQYPAGTLLEYADCIQTDAAINPGNSGGPLFNGSGELIGINGRGSFEKRGRVNVGVGYAISINQIKHFLDHLTSGRMVDHATLGATLVTDERGDIRVANILESSDAYRRGLRFDDRIVRFAGRHLRSVNHFKNILGIFPKDWRVPITYVRDDQEREIHVRLTGVHATERLTEIVQGPAQDPRLRPGFGPRQSDAPPKPRSKLVQNYGTLFEYRRGFVNYYFNRLKRNQVWDKSVARSDFRKVADAKWKLTGTLDGRIDMQIVLGTNESGLRMGDQAFVLDTDVAFEQQLVPDESGGLLVALHLWRSFQVQGPSQFGDVYYLGSIPVFPLGEGHVATKSDVLVATTETIESRIQFDLESGRLIGFEMYPDIDVDPCKLSFSGERMRDSVVFPSELSWTFAEEAVHRFEIKQIELIQEGD